MNGALNQELAKVDAIREAWERSHDQASPAKVAQARRRSLTRHAIETGTIEPLYNLDWGVTEALVAQGLTAEVAAREGGLDKDTLDIIQSQYRALEFLAGWARAGRNLSLSFFKQLHVALCGTLTTYKIRTASGVVVRPLRHAAWRTHQDYARHRNDGKLMEFTPPDHVQSQMDRLIELYQETATEHAIVRAAWLHHRFSRIHPFEGGNGRVARALTLLVLLRAHYAPLVVDRRARSEYIEALDQADNGDLRHLVRFFARREEFALRSELELPAEPAAEGSGALAVARAYAQQLRAGHQAMLTELTTKAEALAAELHSKVRAYLTQLGADIGDQFREADPKAYSSVNHSTDETSKWWQIQIVRTAHEVDIFTSLSKGSWWTRLHLVVFGQTLRFVVVIQRVGSGETGVLAVTVFAEVVPPLPSADDERQLPTPLLESTPTDSVTLVFSDDADERWAEVCELIDRTLAAAVAKFAQKLG